MPGRDRYFPEIVKVLGFGAAFASIPLFASMENLQPPWPSAVAYISAALILVSALIAREYGEGAKRSTRRRLLLFGGLLTVAGLFAYLYLYSRLVLTLASNERLILGFTCNAETASVYANCPNLTDAELSDAGYDLALLYTAGSLQAAKLALVASWFTFTAGLVAAVGWAVAARQDETPEPPAPPAPPEPAGD